MQYVLRDFCYVVVIKTKHLICYNGCTFRFFYNDERGADSKVTKSYKWHLLFMGTQRIPTKIGRHSSISSDSSLHVVTWKEKEWNSKVPFNWKAQDYWPKSHIYLISLNFFPVVLGCYFLVSVPLFWFWSESNDFLASNLKLFFLNETKARFLIKIILIIFH